MSVLSIFSSNFDTGGVLAKVVLTFGASCVVSVSNNQGCSSLFEYAVQSISLAISSICTVVSDFDLSGLDTFKAALIGSGNNLEGDISRDIYFAIFNN